VQIVDVTPWQPYEQVADQLQCGRVLLVGDSAHTMPPLKAGGANTAIQSAHNLAWKLAAVLHGNAGPGLLATYHAERHPVGRFNARQSLTGPTVALLDLDDAGPGLPAEDEHPMFDLLIGYQYHSAAIVDGEPARSDSDTVTFVAELRGQPGTRVPHAWVRRAHRRVSTLDLLGPGFTLLTGDDGDCWRAAATSVAAGLGIPIAVYRIGNDADVLDVHGQWAVTTGLRPDGALLVRPDDFVGWRADTPPADPGNALRQALSAILDRP
jgi:putative polyketide hydroxylase